MRKTVLLCGAAAISGTLFSPAVSAQDESGTDAVEPNRLSTVTVTAQKREQNLIEVPVSATVIDSETIELEGISEGRDVTVRTGGVALSDFGVQYGSDLIARGAGIGRLLLSENATGLFRNDVSVSGVGLAGRNLFEFDFFDVERIEVLKGPQSALYGRNSVGGAVNVINATADLDEFSGNVRVKYGENGLWQGQGVVNIPVVEDEFAIRIGAIHRQFDGGFFEDQNGEAVDDDELTGGRISIAAVPAPNWNVTAFLEGYEYEGPSLSVYTYDAINDVDPFVKDLDIDPVANREGLMAGARVDYETDAGTFSYIGAYRSADVQAIDDDSQRIGAFNFGALFGNNLAATRDFEDNFESNFHELRWVKSTDVFDFVGGLELMNYESDVSQIVEGNTGLLARSNGTVDSQIENTSYAAYGQLDYKVNDKLTLSGQLRYSRDEKDFALQQLVTRTDLSPFFQLVATPVNNVVEESRSYEHWSPGLIVAYSLDDQTNIYAKVTTGYRSGSINNDLGDDTTPLPPNFTQGKESTVSYEAGIKGTLADRFRYGVAVFRQDFDDLQLNTSTRASIATSPVIPAAAASRPVGFLINRGDEEIFGVEVDFQYYVPIEFTGGDLILSGAGSYLDGEYTSDILADAPGQTSIVGNDAALTREYQAYLGATYRQPIIGDTNFIFNYNLVGEYGGAEDFQNLADLEDFTLHNLSVGVSSENWRLFASVDNLTDEQYDAFVFDTIGLNNIINHPRRFSVQLSYNF